MVLFTGLPILNRRYKGGSSQDLAGLGISSVKQKESVENEYEKVLPEN